MSKIKAKDLSYDSSLPPFLQKLYDQHAGRVGDTDRHERQLARPRGAKREGDEEDGPVVVDESGETVSKEEIEKLKKPDGEVAEVKVKDEETEEVGKVKEKKETDGLATKKRKVVKVVGEEDEGAMGTVGEGKPVRETKKKKQAKAKPTKLAFDDD